jgi:hypothetical protein
MRPLIEFVLLRTAIERSGQTFKRVSRQIVLKWNWGLLAERYLIWAMNNPTDSAGLPRYNIYIWPHELEPKTSAWWLGCDAFMSIPWEEGQREIYGIQFGVTLDGNVRTSKIQELQKGRANLDDAMNDVLHRGVSWHRQAKYLPRYMPDGLILFEANNILRAFTDSSQNQHTIEMHEDWFRDWWRKRGSPIDNLDETTRMEIWFIQESFPTALSIWKWFKPNPRVSKVESHTDSFHYTVFLDNHIPGAKPRTKVEVRKKHKWKVVREILYSFSVIQK